MIPGLHAAPPALSTFLPYSTSPAYLNASSAWRKTTSSRKPSLSCASQLSVPVSDCPPHRKLPKSGQQSPCPPRHPVSLPGWAQRGC